jgi:flagellar biosynthesis anti-sigma factor FlgM
MKINPASVYGVYKPTETPDGGARVKNGTSASVPAVEKQDTIQISSQGKAQQEIGRIVSEIMDEVSQNAGAERLESLKAAIADGSYHVSSDDLADAILNWEA